MYTLRIEGKKDMKKAKDVKKTRFIIFEDYTRCLNDAIEMTRRQSYIQIARGIHIGNTMISDIL